MTQNEIEIFDKTQLRYSGERNELYCISWHFSSSLKRPALEKDVKFSCRCAEYQHVSKVNLGKTKVPQLQSQFKELNLSKVPIFNEIKNVP